MGRSSSLLKNITNLNVDCAGRILPCGWQLLRRPGKQLCHTRAAS